MTESVPLESFITGPYFIKIKNKTYELSEWNLGTELWAKKKHGSTQKFYDLLTGSYDQKTKTLLTESDLEVQLEFILYMMKDKKDFSSIEDLASNIDHADFAEIFAVLLKILSDSTDKVKKRNERIKAMQK